MPTATTTTTSKTNGSIPPTATGRGLKGFLTRNRVTSPEPAEPTKSRFRSFVDEVSGRGTVKPSTPSKAAPAPLNTAKKKLEPAVFRPPRPGSPDTATRRTRNLHLPPAGGREGPMETDGRWQQPSLSKGSMSTSALARFRDEDENTARPGDGKKAKGGLTDLFGVTKIERKLSVKKEKTSPPSRPFLLPPPQYVHEKIALDPGYSQDLEDQDRTIRALAAKAAKDRTTQQAGTPTRPSTAQASDAAKPPGSRHTSRIDLHPTHRVSKALPAAPHLTSSNSNATIHRSDRIEITGDALPAEHYQLRLATSVLLKNLTPYIKGPEFASKEKNVEIKRIAADNLAILARMEKAWSGDWTRAALAGMDRKDEEEEIRRNFKMADIGEKAKEREKAGFTSALRDGVLLCLFFNILLKTPGQPPPITQISISQEQRSANITRFVSACSKSALPAERVPLSSDLTNEGLYGLKRTSLAIMALTRLPRPSEAARAQSPQPTVRSAGSRPPSRGVSPPVSPPQRTHPLASPTSSSSPTPRVPTLTARPPATRVVSSPQASRPTSPVRPAPISSRAMEKSRSADSTNNLQLQLQPDAPTGQDPDETPRTTPTTSAILQTPSTPTTSDRPGLLPRHSMSRTPTQPGGSPALRPKSPHSPSTAGSLTPTARRPSLRPRNTTGSASTRVSFIEQSSTSTNLSRVDPVAHTGLHRKERTPSLVSTSTRPSTAYTRSSAAYSVLTVMDAENEVFDQDGSFGRSGIRVRSRRNSEKTLHDARQRIMGTILDTDGMGLREAVEPEDMESGQREAAIQSSLAALEGSPQRHDASPQRPRGPRRGQSLGINGPDSPNFPGGDRYGGGVNPANFNRRQSGVVSPKSMTPNGPSPERSPLKDSFDIPISQPMSRVNSRVSGEYQRIALRPRQSHANGNSVYGYGYAHSNSTVSIVTDGLARNDSRTRLSSIINNSQSSGKSVELPTRSRPVSVITLDIPAQNDVVRYTLSECIGKGQFGSVYKALNNSTGQTVAIKRVSLDGMDEKEAKNVMGEVELLKRLDHPSIVKYMGMHKDSEYLNIILEYVEGGSLGSQLKLCRSFNERLVAMIVAKILEGLAYLHAEGVIHRDLKAANILSTKTGNIKLTDFGVSLNTSAVENIPQEVRTASVRHGKVNWDDIAGTPNWMAPEVIEMSGACFASDIWSLGCTIVELLTGKPPYADLRESMSVMFRIVKDDMPPIPSGLSADLDDFLRTCFRKDPSSRPSATELFDHTWLRRYCPDLPSLRTQDSIPFLRRVSTNFGRPSLDLGDSQSRRESNAYTESTPGLSEHHTKVLALDDSAPRQENVKPHNLIATTFAKPIICGVCGLHVRQGALCQDCHLICHEECAVEEKTHCAQEQWASYARRLGSSSSNAAVNQSASVISIPAAHLTDSKTDKTITRPFPVMDTTGIKPSSANLATPPAIPPRTTSSYRKLCVDTPTERARRISQKSNRTNKSGKSSKSGKSGSDSKDGRHRLTSLSESQPRPLADNERKVEELKEVIMMANAIDTIRQKGQAKAKEAKSECRVM